MRPNIAVHQSHNLLRDGPPHASTRTSIKPPSFSFLSTAKLNPVTLHNGRLQHRWAVSPSDPLSNQFPHNPLIIPTNLPSYIPPIAPPPQRAPPQILQILSLPSPTPLHRHPPLPPPPPRAPPPGIWAVGECLGWGKLEFRSWVHGIKRCTRWWWWLGPTTHTEVLWLSLCKQNTGGLVIWY
jgi:hypothetical protein